MTHLRQRRCGTIGWGWDDRTAAADFALLTLVQCASDDLIRDKMPSGCCRANPLILLRDAVSYNVCLAAN